MLTRRHAIARYDADRGRVDPDRLTLREHAEYQSYAARMLQIYRAGVGRTRADLHVAIARILHDDAGCPPRRIEAFCKLLDDGAAYETGSRVRAARLRRAVFHRAARFHPLVENADRLFASDESRIKHQVAAELGHSWAELERELFSDRIEFQRLSAVPRYPTPESLLARYNVAQIQVALLDAVSMTVWAKGDFKTIMRYVKLARLMHAIWRLDDGEYRIQLDGPASLLRRTPRYGVQMARFLPALIACRDWRMHAILRPRSPRGRYRLDVSSGDGLHSHLPAPDAFDSQVEASFARRWGGEREGWQLEREAEILCCGQKVFLPDFVFQHRDGRRVLMEIVGYWTPQYLEAKVRTLQTFRSEEILLAVGPSAARAMPQLALGAVRYKSALRVEDVLQRLSQRHSPLGRVGLSGPERGPGPGKAVSNGQDPPRA